MDVMFRMCFYAMYVFARGVVTKEVRVAHWKSSNGSCVHQLLFPAMSRASRGCLPILFCNFTLIHIKMLASSNLIACAIAIAGDSFLVKCLLFCIPAVAIFRSANSFDCALSMYCCCFSPGSRVCFDLMHGRRSGLKITAYYLQDY